MRASLTLLGAVCSSELLLPAGKCALTLRVDAWQEHEGLCASGLPGVTVLGDAVLPQSSPHMGSEVPSRLGTALGCISLWW